MSGVVSEKRGEKRIKGVNARRREKNENDRRTDKKNGILKAKGYCCVQRFCCGCHPEKNGWLICLFVNKIKNIYGR